MVNVIFESPRYFNVWQYTVSHRRLLLRSSRDNPPETRIDVHFGGVGYMLLRPVYDGLLIRDPTEEERTRIYDSCGLTPSAGNVYILGPAPDSFVVSGPVQWHEDEGSTDTPSWFGHMVGTK